jgi:hypothetical protein
MTMRTITMDFNQFIILLALISFTIWIWVKSLTAKSCPNVSDEYIILHQKYNKLLKEKKELELVARGFGKLPSEGIMRYDDFEDDEFEDNDEDIF